MFAPRLNKERGEDLRREKTSGVLMTSLATFEDEGEKKRSEKERRDHRVTAYKKENPAWTYFERPNCTNVIEHHTSQLCHLLDDAIARDDLRKATLALQSLFKALSSPIPREWLFEKAIKVLCSRSELGQFLQQMNSLCAAGHSHSLRSVDQRWQAQRASVYCPVTFAERHHERSSSLVCFCCLCVL